MYSPRLYFRVVHAKIKAHRGAVSPAACAKFRYPERAATPWPNAPASLRKGNEWYLVSCLWNAVLIAEKRIKYLPRPDIVGMDAKSTINDNNGMCCREIRVPV